MPVVQADAALHLPQCAMLVLVYLLTCSRTQSTAGALTKLSERNKPSQTSSLTQARPGRCMEGNTGPPVTGAALAQTAECWTGLD
jgi:hypothetical protein